MSSFVLTPEFDIENLYDEVNIFVTLTCYLNNNKLFVFSPETSFNKENNYWSNLLLVSDNEENFMKNLEFPTSNGECSIFMDPNQTIFTVSKSGDGFGGDLDVIIPTKDCKDVFRQIYNYINNYNY
jgi:hypothetical protein